MNRRLIRAASAIALIAGAAAVSGCGQSGPLYLPPPAKHAPTPAATHSPAPVTAASTIPAPATSNR
ncbi:MAG: lipoprotein [Gammaproteobacteria bacterium]